MQEMHISLPADAMAVIAKAVEGGKFSSGSEVIAEALRVWGKDGTGPLDHEDPPFTVRTMEELRAKLQETVDDPRPARPMEEVLDELEAEFRTKYQLSHAD